MHGHWPVLFLKGFKHLNLGLCLEMYLYCCPGYIFTQECLLIIIIVVVYLLMSFIKVPFIALSDSVCLRLITVVVFHFKLLSWFDVY